MKRIKIIGQRMGEASSGQAGAEFFGSQPVAIPNGLVDIVKSCGCLECLKLFLLIITVFPCGVKHFVTRSSARGGKTWMTLPCRLDSPAKQTICPI